MRVVTGSTHYRQVASHISYTNIYGGGDVYKERICVPDNTWVMP